MKKFLLIFPLIIVFFSCDSGEFNNNNPYLPNFSFTFQIDLNLPQYSNLIYATETTIRYDQGNRGVILFNNGTTILAFDIACPNQELSSCSTMTLSNTNLICPCDDASYDLFSGQASGKQYRLKQYRVQVSGNIVTVYN